MALAREEAARAHTRTHGHTQATHSLAINRHKDHGKLSQTLGLHLKEILALIRVAFLEQDLVGANLVRRLGPRSSPLPCRETAHRIEPSHYPNPHPCPRPYHAAQVYGLLHRHFSVDHRFQRLLVGGVAALVHQHDLKMRAEHRVRGGGGGGGVISVPTTRAQPFPSSRSAAVWALGAVAW
jgi:hypothetical protein